MLDEFIAQGLVREQNGWPKVADEMTIEPEDELESPPLDESAEGDNLESLPTEDLMELTAALVADEEEAQEIDKLASLIQSQAEFYGSHMARSFYDELSKLASADKEGRLKEAMEAPASSTFADSLQLVVTTL